MIEKLIEEYNEWAKSKFPYSTAKSSLKGLIRECEEVQEELCIIDGNIESLSIEYVDCLMYLLDSMRRAGVSQDLFWRSFEKKLNINKNRDWNQNEDKTYSHIK